MFNIEITSDETHEYPGERGATIFSRKPTFFTKARPLLRDVNASKKCIICPTLNAYESNPCTGDDNELAIIASES